jgi:hypothetical protein
LPLSARITFFFNQAMDRASVESAIGGEPTLSGRFDWKDDATLSFIADTPLLPDTSIRLTIASSAQSKRGMTLLEPINISYQTAGYLRLTQALPVPGSMDVAANSAITAAFNYPVVPLGGNADELPQAFSIDPPVQGRGEWINTSTYIFYPDPALAGGQTYTIQLDPNLTGTGGNPLESAESWSFTTASPTLLSMEPFDGIQNVRLDPVINLTFSQPMDPESVGSSFTLTSSDGESIAGQSSWDESFTTLVFTPTGQLQRDESYTVLLKAEAETSGGTALGEPFQATWSTLPEFGIDASKPNPNGVTSVYSGVTLSLTSVLSPEEALDFITIEPEVPELHAIVPWGEYKLLLLGDFEPETAYTLTVSAGLSDVWGSALKEPYRLEFSTSALEPDLMLTSLSNVIFLTTRDTGIPAQATNLASIDLSLGSVPLQDLITMLGQTGYDIYRSYNPAEVTIWPQRLKILPNHSQAIMLGVSPDGKALVPGIYMLQIQNPVPGMGLRPLLVVSDYHTTFKLSATDALIWVTDLRQNTPAAGLPIAIYDEEGALMASGTTDEEGIYRGKIPIQEDPYRVSFAVVGNPGDDHFSMAVSGWDQGITPNDFDLPVSYAPPGVRAYLYTDRPIYRPGQTVFFRAVVRNVADGRYALPDLESYPITIFDDIGQELASFELPISAFGTIHGQYTLLADMQPGYYRLEAGGDAIWFQVADYRKPEIDLQLSFADKEILSGQPLVADLEARYFFDAPAGGVPVHWALYAAPADFSLPGYQVGTVNLDWLSSLSAELNFNPFGELIQEGEGQTDGDGKLRLELLGNSSDSRQKLTLEVTVQDESGFPLSARASILVNPADIFIGLRPNSWISQAGQPIDFGVMVVGWDGVPGGVHDLRARLQRVVWTRRDPQPGEGNGFPTFVPSYTLIEDKHISTAADGTALLSFVPPATGIYQVEISGEGALTQVQVWVGGAGQAVWPNLPNQHIQLTADRDEYLPGDTAQVFIPNPFNQAALALLTLERQTILVHQVLEIEPGGDTLAIELAEDYAPNVFVSVTLLGRSPDGLPDFRQGFAELHVKPVEQTLNVTLTSQPERSAPGEAVTFDLRVTNANGEPVQGELSLSVVDGAVLALAEPNAPGILEGLYGEQPLGVRTNLSLAVYGWRLTNLPGGLGGGGGAEELTAVTRQEFPDTAYWDAEIITDANGEAQVTIVLPDNLTTWQVDARGVSVETGVGEEQLALVSSQELLVRPIAPRYLVVGDHVQLAAVAHNNTANELQAQVTLQIDGLALDDPNTAIQELMLPAGGRARVEWWATALDVPSAELVFTVQGSDPTSGAVYEDAVRLSAGALPVLRYSAPQTFATSGVMQEEGQRLELISLPASYDVEAGTLDVNLSTSLAAGMLDALEMLENYPYEGSEQIISRFVPALAAYRALHSYGIESVDQQERMARTLKSGLDMLTTRQNPDGGWGWWPGGKSDIYFSAYALFGLSQARDAGAAVSTGAIQRAIDYLFAVLIAPSMASQNWQLDQLAFQHFALSQAGAGDLAGASVLFESRDRLSPWAQALLGLTLETITPANPQTLLLLSDLQSKAIRSATGVHWENLDNTQQNLDTANTATAIVVYVLAQIEPASSLLPDAVRYLMSNRQADGSWASTYESAWVILANSAYIQGTGELSGDFDFETTLNGSPLVSGGAADNARLTPVRASVSVENLLRQDPNALIIQRDSGTGRLYYTAALRAYLPVEAVSAVDRGLTISRRYAPSGAECTQVECAGVDSAQAGEQISVRLTLALPNDAYHLVVEDYIPAGSEILDTSLKTSQQGKAEEMAPLYETEHPFGSGWGWWLFNAAQIYDDHIAWTAEYLPAGTYELTYTLSILQLGEYHVLPARAWQFYFPEVQGNSAGGTFTINP